VFDSHGEYDAYYFCLKAVMIHAANEAERNRLDVKHCVERNPATSPTTAYNNLKTVPGWAAARRLVGFTELTKRSIGLQAADLMARESFKFIDNSTGRPIRKPLRRLENRVVIRSIGRSALEELKSDYGSDEAALVRYISDRIPERVTTKNY
jgi:hypothetical protein